MKIVVASDHAGFRLKQAVFKYLASCGLDVTDAGAASPDVSVDYPDFARLACSAILRGEYDRGVLVCGTGLGMSMSANRMPGIRAALCHDELSAHQSRAHNDANVLCLGAWIDTPERAARILDEWLKTEFEGGRHANRVAKIDKI